MNSNGENLRDRPRKHFTGRLRAAIEPLEARTLLSAYITGSVFNDHNANGIKDGTSDGALSGRTVLIDANLNGTRDAGETSTATGANGKFTFAGLQPGTYRIIAINPANWKTTAPAAGFINVTVAAGQTTSAGSFGSVHLSTISGTFFNDANSNGLFDSTEIGLAGQTLFLDTNNNGTLNSGEIAVATDASGKFTFSGLIPGAYHLRAIMPSGFHPTVPSKGEKNLTLYSGQMISGNLFGAAQTQNGATIRGSVFNDHNANGIKDGTSDGVLGGRAVFIDANRNGTLDAGETSTLSDASGNFSFAKLQPGTYRINAINPANWKTTIPLAGFVDVTVASGQTLSAGSFGSVHLSTISGTFFNDVNSNGLLDSGELGLSGLTLFLDTNNNGALDTGETSVATDSVGTFTFSGLIPATYHIRAIMPSGFHATVPPTGEKDITLYAGQLISGNLFGAVKTPMGTIAGDIYNDANHDGDCDAGEAGLGGWQAYADTNNDGAWNAGEPIATADASGSYTLVLTAGSYRIREIRQDDWTRTQPTGDWPMGYYDVTLAAGQTISGLDFGNYLPLAEIQQLGGNLNHPSDRIQDHPFVDLVKATRGFYNLAGRLASNGKIDFATTDGDGWPTEDFSFSAADNSEWGVSLDPGVYHMSFVGPVGTVVSIRRDAPNPAAMVPQGTPIPMLTRLGFDDATSTYAYDVTVPQGALVLAFDFQETQGQLRHIKVLQPGYDLSNYPTFRTEYLNLLRDLGPSVLRLMDWTHTNDNPQVDWADRPKITDATQAKANVPGGLQPLKGVAWEYCIQLANTLHTDLWVNVPAHATDDYIMQLATLLRQTLDPTLNTYVEYSNEVWNSGFEQYTYNKNAAGAEVVAAAQAGTSSDLNYDHLAVDITKPDGGANVANWADRRNARQLKTISDIFKTVWTGAGLASPINKQVRPILCSQFANASRFDNMLKFISTVYGAPSKYFYGIGVGAYLDLGKDASKDGLTEDQVLTDLQNDANSYLTNGAFDGIERRAQQWGLSMDAYEGGVDTYGATSITAKAEASLDPRMQDILTGFMTTWFAKGGDLFNYFTLSARSFDSPYGTYAITDDINNLNEPKELAFKAVREELLEN